MSFVLLGILNAQAAGGAASQYFIQKTSSAFSPVGVGINSDGEVYAGDRYSNGVNLYPHIAKFEALGSVQAQQAYNPDNNGNPTIYDLYVRSSNVYLQSTDPQDYCWFAKLNADLSIVWARTLETSAGNNTPRGIHQSLIGWVGNAMDDVITYDKGNIAKLNGSGGLQWDVTVTGGPFYDGVTDITIDGNDDFYSVGYSFGTNQEDSIQLIKHNTSNGSIAWSRHLGQPTSVSGRIGKVHYDSVNDRIYVWARVQNEGPGANSMNLSAWSTSGSLLWQRTVGTTNDDTPTGVTTDSLGNVIVSGYADNFPLRSQEVALLKFNSSGTLIWQRSFGRTGNDNTGGVVTDANNDIYITVGGSGSVLAYLPGDGSLTGSYSVAGEDFEYQPSSFTVTTGGMNQYSYSRSVASGRATARTGNTNTVTATASYQLVNL